jgi:hypothetical protein
VITSLAAAPDAEALRERAREILGDRRYTGTDLPRPFEKPLRWLDDRLRPIADWVGKAFEDVADSLPGGAIVLWLLIVALIATAVVVFIRPAVSRLAARGAAAATPAAVRASAAALEREAAAAERDGRFEQALRLRFRAGLLRLDERQVLEYRDSMTTGDAAGAVGLEAFDRLGADFDAVAYGGRPAGAPELAASRAAWADVLEQAAPR